MKTYDVSFKYVRTKVDAESPGQAEAKARERLLAYRYPSSGIQPYGPNWLVAPVKVTEAELPMCAACHGERASTIGYYDEFCAACNEDGGPHAGDDPFGRSDEDWARHAE